MAASSLNRAYIEQAKGILMARASISADTAYELMSQMSQDKNRKVHAIAKDIIHQTTTTKAP